MADQKKYYTSTAIRVMSAEAVVVKMTKYGPIKDDEKTRQLRQMLVQAAEVQERAFSERMCSLALGHEVLANKIDRIMVGVDSNGSKAAVAGVDYHMEDAERAEDPKRLEADKLRRLLEVAKDALNRAWMYAEKLPHQWPLPVRVRAKMKAALDQIEKEENV